MQAELAGTVWANYRLVTTQWPLPISTPRHGDFHPDERDQHDDGNLRPELRNSCMGCHNFATDGRHAAPASASANFSYLLQAGAAHHGRPGHAPQPEAISAVWPGSVVFNPYVIGGAGGTRGEDNRPGGHTAAGSERSVRVCNSVTHLVSSWLCPPWDRAGTRGARLYFSGKPFESHNSMFAWICAPEIVVPSGRVAV